MLRNDPGTACADIKAQALKKIAAVDEKRLYLARIRHDLTELVEQCGAESDLSQYPILNALDEKDKLINDVR